MAYLDEIGLSSVWSKMRGLVGNSSGGGVTVLYANSSGTNGTVTLSESLSNYSVILVCGATVRSGTWFYGCYWGMLSNNAYTVNMMYQISNMTFSTSITTFSGSSSSSSNNINRIYSVIGIK